MRTVENLNRGFFGAKWVVVACGCGILNENRVFVDISLPLQCA